ncbi:MAG TPA: hypothetical protein VES73_12090 [Lamprocystis sp. (in: g-proteobacteria)]|nr:hypothetical protein [Lamprocystis sp. (in: g-proteobacteria)]
MRSPNADDPPSGDYQHPDLWGGEGPTQLTDQSSIRAAALCLADRARRELLIFSRDLEPASYDQGPFLEAVRRLALRTPRQPVRVLVREPRLAVLAGHRLIELARRLSSRISIRRVADDFQDRVDAFLIADASSYCRRRLADRHEALVEFQARGRAGRLRATFEHIWEQSDDDSDLRRLYL